MKCPFTRGVLCIQSMDGVLAETNLGTVLSANAIDAISNTFKKSPRIHRFPHLIWNYWSREGWRGHERCLKTAKTENSRV